MLAALAASILLAAGAEADERDFLASLAAEGRSLLVQPLPDTPHTLRTTLDEALSGSRAPAEVWAARQWFSAMEPTLSRHVKDPLLRSELLRRVYHEATLAGLPPELVLALIQVESAFQFEAVSSAGAVGLMQIMPFWIRELGLPADDLKDPWRNLRYGCTILAHYLAVEDGDFTRALARYNGSLGKTWYPERVMRAWQRHWRPVDERVTVQR
ncbi:lytic transglycosylase domain-containing protein [Halomonas sp. SSL-5]|uniref:lytic transglycosylase domain-containing protein n=1 Tax=Halomonas sp. SSL-5 TaxID=3065855 RepID=UPI0027385223|nr:lytic transglycosylase domain-containing protein [Halomonas sp. SSL-5]MDY7116647.1 lytic transglycosylase domain-containing protein [Halomonas sp. SSL-5]